MSYVVFPESDHLLQDMSGELVRFIHRRHFMRLPFHVTTHITIQSHTSSSTQVTTKDTLLTRILLFQLELAEGYFLFVVLTGSHLEGTVRVASFDSAVSCAEVTCSVVSYWGDRIAACSVQKQELVV
jgi:hypothetical protein